MSIQDDRRARYMRRYRKRGWFREWHGDHYAFRGQCVSGVARHTDGLWYCWGDLMAPSPRGRGFRTLYGAKTSFMARYLSP